MAKYETQHIRNIALVGQAGAGKTTLVETLLHRTGAIGSPGSVERKNTVCDYDPIEKEHGHSLVPSIVSYEHLGSHVNLLDTPGYLDFVGQSLTALEAVETVAVVVNAKSGIEPLTRRMMARAAERGLDRMIIINRIDNEGVDLAQLVERIQNTFGKECLPINLPADGGAKVRDCFFKPDGEATDFSGVAEAHTALVEQVVEVDEKLMEVYLEQGEELSP